MILKVPQQYHRCLNQVNELLLVLQTRPTIFDCNYMFISNYKATSPAKRWSSTLKGAMVQPFFSKYVKNKFLGNQGEQKKHKRKRKIGPSQVLQSTHHLTPEFDTSKTIVAAKKTARTAHLLILCELSCGIKYYRRAHQGFKYGRYMNPLRGFFISKQRLRPGEIKPLFRLSTGAKIFNVPILFNTAKMLARAPGTFCKILWHLPSQYLTVVRSPSKKLFKIPTFHFVQIGRNANKHLKQLTRGCAKKTTKQYKKVLKVRGVAMNPVDHPNGGRANTKQPLKNPWGRIAKKNK